MACSSAPRQPAAAYHRRTHATDAAAKDSGRATLSTSQDHVRLALQWRTAGIACRRLYLHEHERIAAQLGALTVFRRRVRARVRAAQRAAEARGHKVDLEPLAAAAIEDDAAARQALVGLLGCGCRSTARRHNAI